MSEETKLETTPDGGLPSTELFGSCRAIEWQALTSKRGMPMIIIADDADFERHVDSVCSAYKQYPEKEDGSTDYSEMQAVILRFGDHPEALLIRKSSLPNAELRRDAAPPMDTDHSELHED